MGIDMYNPNVNGTSDRMDQGGLPLRSGLSDQARTALSSRPGDTLVPDRIADFTARQAGLAAEGHLARQHPQWQAAPLRLAQATTLPGQPTVFDILPPEALIRGAARGGGLGALAETLRNVAERHVETAREDRITAAAAKMGFDLTAPEGLLAADAYEATMEWASTGMLPGVAKGRGPDAQIAAEAHALYELAHPATFEATRNPANQDQMRTLAAIRAQALAALAENRLTPNPDGWSQGWTEIFPELTDWEKALGELPGFTAAQAETFQEGFTIAPPALPNHTGQPAPLIDLPQIISTPIPENAGPNIVAARPESYTTPAGNIIQEHGKKGGGLDYITLKGHTPEQIDDIIANPRLDLSGFILGRGRLKGQDIKLLTGHDGHWVKIDEDGNIFATSNRNLSLKHDENDPDAIIKPLETP
ncbi:MAG: hypothetical protein Q4G24_11730 [Paracoccus sp. (in: a-proteobacteria)]|uniref:hypothetical protein n=1 Tax=Paracoccus sp. TaxID=267 RepID=UPI0026E0B78D|nr:hypothetical protein [Paracoccus sp. (in: a-proteobacteria)]MDO5622126.1 hypothetical protein [Paracoccus sp. (in: a-proteobacteria)]